MRILYVCTANICRSASAQQLLREAVAGDPLLSGIEVRSAGTHAVAGSPGCVVAPALAGHAHEHRAQPLTDELVDWADLILPLARDHRRAITLVAPRARTRTFTIRQAGRIADWLVDSGMVVAARERAAAGGDAGPEAAGTGGVVTGGARLKAVVHWADRYPPGDPRGDVAAMPDDPSERWLWMVSEMDAARGMTVAPGAGEQLPDEPKRRFRLARSGRPSSRPAAAQPLSNGAVNLRARRDSLDPNDAHPDDVPDPHVLGTGLHPLAFEQIESSTDALVRLLREVASRDR